jgi:DNA-binding transcriptional ArsR family regulator
MKLYQAAAALAALAHEGRLAIFRRLVEAGPAGLAVGEIARPMRMPAPTLSFHLGQLQQAGLVASRRQGRRLIQTADFAAMNGLLAYLTENCCGGDPKACSPNARGRAASSRRVMR